VCVPPSWTHAAVVRIASTSAQRGSRPSLTRGNTTTARDPPWGALTPQLTTHIGSRTATARCVTRLVLASPEVPLSRDWQLTPFATATFGARSHHGSRLNPAARSHHAALLLGVGCALRDSRPHRLGSCSHLSFRATLARRRATCSGHALSATRHSRYRSHRLLTLPWGHILTATRHSPRVVLSLLDSPRRAIHRQRARLCSHHAARSFLVACALSNSRLTLGSCYHVSAALSPRLATHPTACSSHYGSRPTLARALTTARDSPPGALLSPRLATHVGSSSHHGS
jgi:hypothetical protein